MTDSSHTLGKSVLGTGALQIPKLFNVEGWVAIVTGGGTGLGLITAAALAANGAKVYITGRRLEPLEQAAKSAAPQDGKGQIIPIQADASNKEGILKVREFIQAREKWVNVLINNHGVSLEHAMIDEVEQTPEALSKEMFENETFDHWLDAYRINTASYYFTSFAFLPLLAAAKTVGNFPEAGNILNLGSVSGITVTSQRGQFSYNANKAATISLSHQLAAEFARRGLNIRVNVVCPGYFPSGMSPISDEFAGNNTTNEFRQKWGTPFGRAGNAVDYAQCIFSLIANQYVTGAELVIDGGWLLVQGFGKIV
ncbi:short-chain dehydrogenase [Kwoniella heveanensis BCC8398]|uniref:Short-chain dehydrogenase n=1 Tax=Kwoniella heveanensis BCC8398 TaxID=1296120 RepID=A0A1B9GJJ4_9TREE|nr:short-chain dehydrogenase [Kwoniella heveanensis BCC8398]